MSKQYSHNQRNSFLPANEQIRSREVMLIDEETNTKGVVPISQALILARERELDLVLVAPGANPPVARIVDAGKLRYEKEKEQRKQKKKQAANEIKEIRLSPQMEEHDIEQRVVRAAKFIGKGHRIKLSMRFRGRQNIYRDRGIAVLQQFAGQLNQEFEEQPKFSRNIVNVLLKATKANETKNEADNR